ncbi:BnaCnng16880D [Brassica napus]|uniref:BnaCnng16880D protein n=1 Tax=Brassica napus TaxID=3708 RepID=A0A078IEB4_BRANA|nr:BnaCnng16880D [Brassica napus]
MSEDAKALSMIRQITNRNINILIMSFNHFVRIAREEDEMEAKLIAEEEERERQRKLLKLRRKKIFV